MCNCWYCCGSGGGGDGGYSDWPENETGCGFLQAILTDCSPRRHGTSNHWKWPKSQNRCKANQSNWRDYCNDQTIDNSATNQPTNQHHHHCRRRCCCCCCHLQQYYHQCKLNINTFFEEQRQQQNMVLELMLLLLMVTDIMALLLGWLDWLTILVVSYSIDPKRSNGQAISTDTSQWHWQSDSQPASHARPGQQQQQLPSQKIGTNPSFKNQKQSNWQNVNVIKRW